MSELEPTGERLLPERQHGELVHAEHLVRYRLAAQLAGGRRVLDAACGEGYGTELLAGAGAASALGVDLDEGTIEHARARHPGPQFAVADVRKLPYEEGSFDLAVSFETIEHVPDPERVLDELRRVLAPDGLLVVSTPNKREYRVDNEFHEREFTHEEFVALLAARFDRVEVLLQHNWLASAVLAPPLAREASGAERHELELWKVAGIELGGELYTVALCGAGELPALRPLAVTATTDEAHRLAERLVAAERMADLSHRQFKAAQSTLLDVYGSVWWRMTAPLRRLVELGRRRRG